MEINTNPNYLNNVQNQNAQGANSATAENVVEENLFDGNEANATQNNAVSQDYQNAEMLNTFVAAFMQMMIQFMGMMTQQMNPQPTQTTEESQTLKGKLATIANNISTVVGEHQATQNDQAPLLEYQEAQDAQEAQESQESQESTMSLMMKKLREHIKKEAPRMEQDLQNDNKLLELFNKSDKNHDGILNEADGYSKQSSYFGADINKYRTILQKEYDLLKRWASHQ